MAYVPGCRHDLFISYASENNREGWVEQFATALGHELGDLLGRQFVPKESIFFDRRDLEVAQSFPDRLAAAARQSAILIPILSPGYLTSDWCRREKNEFFSSLPHGAQPADCLAPVLIRPIENPGLDKLYRDAHRLSFLGPDAQTPFAAGSPDWIAELRKLAGQLRNALKNLRQKCRPVFLGKTAARWEPRRAWCSTEVERRFFRTAPESLLVFDDEDTLRASLQESGLAVHFLGGADTSAMDAIETSVEICPGPTILYQPFGADLTSDEQFWLGEFERGLTAQAGRYQRLTGKNDQELVALIDEQMTRAQEPADTAPEKFDLALVCEEADLSGVRELKEGIASQVVCALQFPDFLGVPMRAMERLRKWQDYLSRGEALLFYYGAADRNRLELIWQKAETSRPAATRTWYLAPPDIEEKLRSHPGALVSADQVIRLVEQVRGRRG